jgi:sigma-B regulation protein RsbU (phosphoserine phosphatase)
LRRGRRSTLCRRMTMQAKRWFRDAEQFVRSYTKGMGESEFSRLFDRDAVRAFDVITREHDREQEPEKGFWRFLYRARIFFLGLSFKLSPPRRLLFAICIVLAAIGLTGIEIHFGLPFRRVLFFSLSVAGLVLLLVLELADRVVVRDELEVARELQRELLPREAPAVAGYDFAFSYRTANTIGGDYYDFLELEDGRLVVVIGDASGHGIAAGLLMAIASSALRLGFDAGFDPATAAALVNRALCRTGGRRAFMTLFCGVLELRSGRLRYVCAGHPFPFLRRADGGVLELGTGTLPLGMRIDTVLESHEEVVEPGDTLLLYTDGLVETLDQAGESYGFERLRRGLARGGSSGEIHDRVLHEFDRFRGDEPVYDDRSLVVICRQSS